MSGDLPPPSHGSLAGKVMLGLIPLWCLLVGLLFWICCREPSRKPRTNHSYFGRHGSLSRESKLNPPLIPGYTPAPVDLVAKPPGTTSVIPSSPSGPPIEAHNSEQLSGNPTLQVHSDPQPPRTVDNV